MTSSGARLVNIGYKPVRCALCVMVPFFPKCLPQGLVFLLHSPPQPEWYQIDHTQPTIREDLACNSVKDTTLCEPRSPPRLHKRDTYSQHQPRGVARVSDNRIGPGRDKLVVSLDGELESEIATQCLVAPKPGDCSCNAEDETEKEGCGDF